MCGITGIIALNAKARIDVQLLQGMTSRIKHRGPDDEGYLLADQSPGGLTPYFGEDTVPELKASMSPLPRQAEARIGMGFRRLSIVELNTCGHQPMLDRQLDLAITFNGEIYNHPELRQELSAMGYSFYSKSDTEVILKAYHAWGDACVQRFNGMWAFAIWDARQQRLFCSRDRYGIKPFYYAVAGDFMFWGSEMKQLLLAPIDKQLNTAMIWRSNKINALMVYDRETYWRDIHNLLPGHNLSVNNGIIEIKQYYHLEIEALESSQLSFPEAVQEYQSLFRDAIALQMRSDVEIGASLSGGMDSSAIVCSAASYLTKPMQTFSAYYADTPALDERRWIETIVRRSSSISHLISPDAGNALDWWAKATYINDLPIAAGFVSQYAVMQKAHAEGIKVLLSGQGSDELNGGYRHAAYRYFADQLRSIQLGKLGKELPSYLQGMKAVNKLSSLAKIGLSALLPESALYRLEFSYYRFEPFNRSFTSSATASSNEHILQHITDIEAGRLSNFLYNMMNSTSIQTLLHFEDRISMANSVESRVPFLDHRLVDLLFSLPSAYKSKPPETKLVHRAAMQAIIPAEIYNRKDKGIFSSPFYQQWMKGALKPFILDIFGSAEFRNRGIWNLPRIMANWQRYLDGDMRPAEMLYNVIALEIWFKEFGSK